MPTAAELNVIIAAKLDKLIAGVDTANKKLDDIGKGASSASSKFKGLSKQALDVAKGMGLAFGAQEIFRGLSQLITDSARLAAETEGVARAFDQLNNPGLLRELQVATAGTLSNLELMKSAVQFDNFNLPLNQLGTLMQFVQRRAEQTGESVEFLRQSLVEGLAKGSKLRLDNLGFSISDLNSKIKETGSLTAAVAKLATEQLDKMGNAGDTAKTKMDRLGSSITNLKINIGEFINQGTGPFSDAINTFINNTNKLLFDEGRSLEEIQDKIRATTEDYMANFERLQRFQSGNAGILDKMFFSEEGSQEAVDTLLQRLDELYKLQAGLFPGANNPDLGGTEGTELQLGAIDKLQAELEDLVELQQQAGEAGLPEINVRIYQINEEISRLKELGVEAYKAAQSYKELKALGPVDPLALKGPNVAAVDPYEKGKKLPTLIKTSIPVTKELTNSMEKLNTAGLNAMTSLTTGFARLIKLIGEGKDSTDQLVGTILQILGTVASLAFASTPGGSLFGGFISSSPSFLSQAGANKSVAPQYSPGSSANRLLQGSGQANREPLIVEGSISGSVIKLSNKRQSKSDFRNFGG